ncbi:family 78 glycoside hydrolase catalytic domain [Agromyces subbeticus]|uniref:family 78 glycoside hydrolase catalytic domain n=1 Tax=Agromyces subbeticus TaxID=293890 RepID=UPI0004175731|nr:family 78 glycoside hydrolase catalytic domain [Agromyces subbeticus]
MPGTSPFRSRLRRRGTAVIAAVLGIGLAVSGLSATIAPAEPASAAPAAAAAPGLALSTLEVENRSEPLGIDVEKPRFSWVVESDERDVEQTSYRLRVAPAGADIDDDAVWDSGVVASAESTAVEFGGERLAPATDYRWQVDVETNVGEASAGSTFSTGLFAEDDWAGSAWIGRDRPQSTTGMELSLAGASWIHPPYPGGNTPPGYFRKTFDLPSDKIVDRAEFVMSGDMGFSAHLNGTQIASGASVSDAWKTATRVQAFPLLGENVLAVRLDNAAKAYGAVVGKLVVRFTDGSVQEIVTDGSWLSSESAKTGWQAKGYDTSGWVAATARAPYGGSPWGEQVTVPVQPSADTRNSFDTASWIIPPIGTPSAANPIPSTLFRTTVTVSETKEVAWAQLAMTGDQQVDAYWNGTKVTANTGGNNDWQTARVVNLSTVPGENALAFALTTPGTSQNGGVLASLRIGYTDGTTEQVVTNSGFSSLISSAADAPSGWNLAEFDDSTWQNAQANFLYRNGVYGGRVTIPELDAGGDVLTFDGANWIWTPEAGAPVAPAEDRAFRTTLETPSGTEAVKAEIILTADDSFKLWVNGALIGQTEGATNEWQGSKRFRVDLEDDDNVFAVRTTNGPGSPAGLLAVIRVAYADGSEQLFRTDAAWKASKVIPAGFEEPDFDDSAWAPARVQAVYGTGPWGAGVRLPVEPTAAAPLLRKEFTVDRAVATAKIYVAAGGYANLSLNGAPINDEILSPGFTDYDDHAQYTVTDLTDQLAPGDNALGMELGRGFYGMTNPNVWNWQKPPFHDEPVGRVLLRIEYTDGTSEDIVSDRTWNLHDGPTLLDDLFGGETYDANRVQSGFDTVGFDDGDWVASSEVAGPAGTLINQQQQPIRITERLEAESVDEVVDGVYVVKFPRVIAGTVEFTAEGEAGTTIRAQYGEKLLENGRPNFSNNGGFANGFQTDRFILAGTDEPETWAGRFSYKGFQYIEVTGWPGDSAPPAEAFVAEVLHTDAAETGSFESANAIMNQTHRAVVDTMLNNIHSIPTDTPMFEKNGWTGDAAVGAEMFLMNLDTQNLFEKWIGDINDSRDAAGAPLVIAPSSGQWGQWGVAPVWHSAYVLIPWWLYQYGGDVRVLEQYYDGMKAYVDLEFDRSNNGLVRENRLGDWVSPEASPAGGNAPEDARVSGTAYLYTMLVSMEKTASLLGQPGDAAHFATQAETVKEAFNTQFLDVDAGLYRGSGDRGYRQTHNALALAFGLTPDEATAERVAASLAADVTEKGDKLNTGTIGSKYLLPMLTKYGYEDLAFRVAVQTEYPSWGFMIENGATTMWEHWALEARSRGHYFLGTVDDWFFHDVAGIRSSELTGYRDVSIAPRVTDQLDWAKATTPTPFGPISVDWKKQGERLSLETHVPVGSTATVRLPASNVWAVTEGGEPLDDVVDGVRSVELVDGEVVVTIGSGDYAFDVDPTAGSVGAILDAIDALQSQAEIERDAGHLGAGQFAELAELIEATRDRAESAYASAGDGTPAQVAKGLARVLEELDAIDAWIAALADAVPALGERAGTVRSVTNATLTGLLGISVAVANDAPGYKPGAPITITGTARNGSVAAIDAVTAQVTGLADGWAAMPEATELAERLKADETGSVDLGLQVPADQVPGPVPATVSFGYTFEKQRVETSAALSIVVDSPVTMTVQAEPATVFPGGATALRAIVVNAGEQPAVGRIEATVPDGWVVPLPGETVIVAPGASAQLEVPVFVPLGTDRAPNDVELSAVFAHDGVTFAQASTVLTVGLEPITSPPAGYDHVDLGDSASEQAHGLTASSSSGTNTEAGLTRRYAGHLTDFSYFEFDAAVVEGEPFVLRVTETYDRAQTKKYKVYVDGVEVAERLFSHTGGVGTETYELVVDAGHAPDGPVRVKFENLDDHGFYDPSIADVWTLPVAADVTAPQVTATLDPAAPDRSTGWYRSAPVAAVIEARDDRTGEPGVEAAVGDENFTEVDGPFAFDAEGSTSLRYRATDASGNRSDERELTVKIDTMAPVTEAVFGDGFDGDTATGSGTIEFSAEDATSGVATTRYRVGDGAWQAGESVVLDRGGAFTVEYASTDAAGNVETVQSISGTIVIPDTTAPAVAHEFNDPGDNGWLRGDSTVQLTAADDESGIDRVEFRLAGGDWQRYTAPIHPPAGVTAFEYRAIDLAGNVSVGERVELKVDGTAPSAWARLTESGRVTAIGSDGGSGVDRVEYSLDGRSWHSSLTALVAVDAEPTRLSLRTVDVAGNVGGAGEIERGGSSGTLAVEPGMRLLVEASGFGPGAVVRVELHSDPVVLGIATADERGVVALQAVVPPGVPAGAHELVLVSESGGGSVTVPTDVIAHTGFDPAPWLAAAAVLLLLGASWMVMGRRRGAVTEARASN